MKEQNHFADIFCRPTDTQKYVIDEILFEIVSLDKDTLNAYYDEMRENYLKDEEEFKFFKELKPSILKGIFSNFSEFNSLGIDIPVWYGDLSKDKKTMIIGKDPKRNSKKNDLTVGCPFDLVNFSSRHTEKNYYWKFLSPMLLKNENLYITDIYKLYFQADNSKSNETTAYFREEIHKTLLEKEIKFVKPDTIITLGKDAQDAVIGILELNKEKIEQTTLTEEIEGKEITFHFVPHISRLNLQSITTVANLFIALGKLKSNEDLSKELIEVGKKIKDLNKKLFE